MSDAEARAAIAARYRRFAIDEAAGQSPKYELLTHYVADSEEILAFLASLPRPRQQPNLLLAAVRHIAGVPEDGHHLLDVVRSRQSALRDVMLARTTQTNEPARCAVLLPVLTALPGPLALLEVGAAAGLCLFPDRYGYDYGTCQIPAPSAGAPTFRCEASAGAPLPKDLPEVGWRAGLDLNPLDLDCKADVAWLQTLVWPELEDRARCLTQAIDVVRGRPSPVRRGDLLEDLDALMATAPAGANLVVYHTAVLAYVESAHDRAKFAEQMLASDAVWISNEAAGVIPQVFDRLDRDAVRRDRFLLAVDGEPTAWTGPHGQSIDWLSP